MDSQFNKICVLNAFGPFLRLLKAYNFENCHYCDSWRQTVRGILDALCLTSMIPQVPILVILGLWYLVENSADLKKIVASLPMLFSLLQMSLTFTAMIIKNRTISDTIDQVQSVVDEREFFKFFH